MVYSGDDDGDNVVVVAVAAGLIIIVLDPFMICCELNNKFLPLLGSVIKSLAGVSFRILTANKRIE